MTTAHATRRFLLAASFCLAAATAVADDAHHPREAAPPSPPAAMNSSPTAAGPTAPGMGMMGQGMMGQGMMGHRMVNRDAHQPGGMSMMSMMGMGDAARLERVQGLLAFLEAELKISDAQRPLWTAFAQAARLNAEKHNGMAAMAPKPDAGPVDRLAHQEHALAARLDGVRAMKAALTPLYAALNVEQKKTFAELLPMRMTM